MIDAEPIDDASSRHLVTWNNRIRILSRQHGNVPVVSVRVHARVSSRRGQTTLTAGARNDLNNIAEVSAGLYCTFPNLPYRDRYLGPRFSTIVLTGLTDNKTAQRY